MPQAGGMLEYLRHERIHVWKWILVRGTLVLAWVWYCVCWIIHAHAVRCWFRVCDAFAWMRNYN
ncbi:unnamed protein product, partial [Pylaiella littoralis]